jgi:hypothetical protein
VELVAVSLTRSGGLASRLQSPVAQLLPLHGPEKEFKIVLPELVYVIRESGVGYMPSLLGLPPEVILAKTCHTKRAQLLRGYETTNA